MSYVRIKHKNLHDGVLLHVRDFDASVHELFDAPAAAPAGDSGTYGASIEDALKESAADVIAMLKDIDEVPFLQALAEAEAAGKGRKTVLAAIDARNAELAAQ